MCTEKKLAESLGKPTASTEDFGLDAGEPIYQTRWSRPETVWGDVSKDVYDRYVSFGYAARRIVYVAKAPS